MKGRIQPGPATLLLILTLWSAKTAWAQNDPVANPNYDAELARQLGGDDYGMKSYFLIILKTGANTTADKEQINASFRGHLENINKLVEQEKLVVRVL